MVSSKSFLPLPSACSTEGVATAHPCDREQRHLSRAHFRCVVWDTIIILAISTCAISAKASHSGCLTNPGLAGCLSPEAKESPGGLRACPHSLECGGNALRARVQRQTGPRQGLHMCSHGRASSKQLCWGILGFLLSAPVICGAHLCLVAVTVQHPSAKIPQQREPLALPPVSVSSIHSLLSL